MWVVDYLYSSCVGEVTSCSLFSKFSAWACGWVLPGTDNQAEIYCACNDHLQVCLLVCSENDHWLSLHSATLNLSHFVMMCSCELWPPATHRLLVHYLQHSLVLYHTYMYLFLVHSINIQTQSLHECACMVFIIRCRACVVESSHFSDEKTILFEDSLQEWSAIVIHNVPSQDRLPCNCNCSN